MKQKQSWEANISGDAEESLSSLFMETEGSLQHFKKTRKIYSLESKVFSFDVHNKWAMDHVGAFQPTASPVVTVPCLGPSKGCFEVTTKHCVEQLKPTCR